MMTGRTEESGNMRISTADRVLGVVLASSLIGGNIWAADSAPAAGEIAWPGGETPKPINWYAGRQYDADTGHASPVDPVVRGESPRIWRR